MGVVETEIIVPEHTRLEYKYCCDICGKDLGNDVLAMSTCLLCGREACVDCCVLMKSRGEVGHIVLWNLLSHGDHICNVCMEVGKLYMDKLYSLDDTFAVKVVGILDAWRVVAGEQRTPANR